MPSQLAHLVFASQSIKAAFDHVPLPVDSPYLGFGAQGPDIFYHNRRRKPSGLEYGALLHRRGYGTAVAALVSYGTRTGLPLDSDYGAYVAAFSTHALLDRIIHPFVNYFAGWAGYHRLEGQSLPFQLHAYFERVLDCLVLERLRGLSAASFDFVATFDCGEQIPADVAAGLEAALCEVTGRARSDAQLNARLRNAYLDALGFYRTTNLIDRPRLQVLMQQVDDPHRLARWLSLIHPVELPSGIDFTNEAHAGWYHPCGPTEMRHESFWDLWRVALDTAPAMLQAIAAAWEGGIEPQALVEIVGDQNLSDGRRVGRPCRDRRCAPLPLADHLTRLVHARRVRRLNAESAATRSEGHPED
ncbi:MAG: hypothetical protein EA384_05850 [Spirochaetaceae bacterium]|nr:MAG: hypothetical protein EA384_05850 [Spirochaetaceae bacterium]